MLSRASLLCKSTSAPIVSRRWHHGLVQGRSTCAALSTLSNNDILRPSHTLTQSLATKSPPTQFQKRTFAGRKDRHSAAFETRPPTKKQRKAYHRRQRKLQYEVNKHSIPNSKARERRAEQREHNQRLIEIAKEEEHLKGELSLYFNKVREIQDRIEASDKFQALLKDGKTDPSEIKQAAREAAKKAAAKDGVHHPPLPSWVQDRMTYDWGDALIDDLMGNSADLTSSLSPYPIYMGGEYGRLRRKVERILRLKEEENVLLVDITGSSSTGGGKNLLSDRLISDLLRSHRDANGKRTTPIGLGPSLQLLFQDLNIPRSELGIQTYVSLLTCCQNPWEARKVNEMRQTDGIRSNEYFWSALVDVYARSGDYLGAENVLDEMLKETKKEYEQQMSQFIDKKSGQKVDKPIAIPPLPAYTSFLSSCYKLVSRPDVHPSIKSDAANRAWNRWKEMRIHSVPPDAMAYGAIMRIFAAQGRAEKAVDLLEEVMNQLMMPVSAENVLNSKGLQEEILRCEEGDKDGWYDDREGKTLRVKPTTLLFTSALNSVAKSHEIACRFSGGKSRKHRQRESIASYHGRLARKIVILAEQAEVEQDDGFVSALMLCAAAAGDSSTARAIYLASKVRRLDHLRTCGGKDHLKKLQGLIPEEDRVSIGPGGSKLAASQNGNAPALRTIEEEMADNHKAYEEREYGTDTRPLTALLLAHSKAMEPQGLGSMWAGKFNRGYLCENSLRWIEAYNQPKMQNMAIPGITSVEAGLTAEGWEAEDFGEDTKQLRKKNKFSMQQIMDDQEGNRRDDLDPFYDGYDPDPDDIPSDYIPTGSRDWLTQLPEPQQLPGPVNSKTYSSSMNDDESDSDDEDSGNEEEYENDLEENLARARSEPGLADEDEEFNRLFEDTMRQMAAANIEEEVDSDDYDELDGLIDEEEFERLMADTMHGMDDTHEDAEALNKIPGVADNDYGAFRAHLEAELRAEGAKHDVDEKEARQLFAMMRTYYSDGSSIQDADFSESGEDVGAEQYSSNLLNDFEKECNAPQRGEGMMQPQMKASSDPTGTSNKMMYADDFLEMVSSDASAEHKNSEDSSVLTMDGATGDLAEVETPAMQMALQRERKMALGVEDPHIAELKELLPGMPMNRLEKITDEFSAVLGYPSILRLALALRENMPDAFSPQCLARKNLANAKHLFAEASKSKVVDVHLLNAMLKVQTNAGRVDPAIRFHETEFKNHNVSPTTHSDRLLLDMFVKKKRIDRALKLKSKIEDEGRTLDLLSYGVLVEYFGKQQQLGSAFLLIKECKNIHGSPPGDKSLRQVRELCRKHRLEKRVGLEELIGKDHLEWLRKGKQMQKSRKRKGNSQVLYAKNRMLDI